MRFRRWVRLWEERFCNQQVSFGHFHKEMSGKASPVKCMDSGGQSGLGRRLYHHWHGMAFGGSGLNDVSMTSVYLKKSMQIPGLEPLQLLEVWKRRRLQPRKLTTVREKGISKEGERQMHNVEHLGGVSDFKRDSVTLYHKGRSQVGGVTVEGEQFLCDYVSTLCGF